MENGRRYDFYFTYSFSDRPLMGQISEYITKLGYSSFFLENYFSSGFSVAESAINGIRDANVAVFLITKNFINSPGCAKEAYMAIGDAKNYDKLIIPVVDKNVLKKYKESSIFEKHLSKYNYISIDFSSKSCEDIAKLIIKNYQISKKKEQLYDKLNEYIQIKYVPGIVDSAISIYSIIKKSLFKIKLEEDEKDLSPFVELIDLLQIADNHIYVNLTEKDNVYINKMLEMVSNIKTYIDYKNAYMDAKNPTLLKVSIVLTLVSRLFDVSEDMLLSRYNGGITVPLRDEEALLRDVLLDYYNNLINYYNPDEYKVKEQVIINGVNKLTIVGWRKVGEETLKTRMVEEEIKAEKNPLSDQLFAIAKYINESNKLFEKLSDEDVTFEFLSCLKTSYERLKNYSELVKCDDVCAYCIEKLAFINQKLDNYSSENSQEGFKEGVFKALLGLKQPEAGSYDVFLSYNHQDEDLAGSIYRFLKSNLLSVFYDKMTLPQLGKSEYHDAIMNSLDKSNNFVIVLSDLEYMKSHWVDLEMKTFNTEISEGRKQGNFIFVVTNEVYFKITQTNKKCLPIQYRGYEIIRVREYKDLILSYINKE